MIHQTPTGGSIEISLEKFLDMTDEEYNEYIWTKGGMEIEDPFFDSSILKKKKGRGSYDEIYSDIEEEIFILGSSELADDMSAEDLDIED